MTILNFQQRDDRQAIILADTRHTLGGETSKLMPLPHLRAIVAHRGWADAAHTVLGALLTFSTFDEALASIHGVFLHAVARSTEMGAAAAAGQPALAAARQAMRDLYDTEADHAHEMILVGWSEACGAVRAVCLTATTTGEVRATPDLQTWAAPSHPAVIDMLEGEHPLGDTALRLLVRMQLEGFRKQNPRAAAEGLPGFGGRLLLGKVTRGEVSVRDLGAL